MLQNFWNHFKASVSDERNYQSAFSFGTDARQASEALELILNDRKTAMIYPANGYRTAMQGNAQPGMLNIVTDWNGVPKAVIETTDVVLLPFNELTDAICNADSACESFAAWREVHQPAIKLEVEELGREFSEDESMVVESFRLIYSE